MATKKKSKSRSKAKATAFNAADSANTNTSGASSSNRSSKSNSSKQAFDFSSFMNPQQFMNSFTQQQPSFNAGNVQQIMEQLMQTSQKNLEAMAACTQLAMERTKELMEEQANFANRFLQETTATWQETMNNDTDTKDKMEEIADYTKNCLEKAATQARKTTEENMQIAQKIGNTLSKRVTETLDEIRSAA